MMRRIYRAFITILMVSLAGALLVGCDTTDTSDYYGPRVLRTSPINGAVNTPTGTSINVLFTEAVEPSSVTENSFLVREISGAVTNVSGAISVGGNTAVFVPDVPLAPETTYIVTLVSSITDVHVNYMTSNYSWYFTTGLSPVAFDTFSPAHIVAGQPDFTSVIANSTEALMNAPEGGPFVYNSLLYIPDTANNRVLGFMDIPVTNGASADFVLGQPNFINAGAGSSPAALNSPSSVYIDGSRTFVADTLNNRLLIWNSVAMTNAANADIAVGQPDLYENAAGCTNSIMNSPAGLTVAGGRLIASDTLNNRVLVWNSIPTLSNTPADMVLGQSLFNSCAAQLPVGAGTLDSPRGIWSDGARLVVADTNNNRVLIWKNFPALSNTSADIVLGQPGMTDSQAYLSALDMDQPTWVSVSADNMLYVVDSGNSRVMVWNRVPVESYTPADAVIGQSAFYHNACNDSDGNNITDSPSARTLCAPGGVHAYGIGNIVVSDTANNRVLIYNAP